MTNALVKEGDIRGALAIADNFTSAGDRGFTKGVIVAQQIAAGDLPGAKATLLRFSPREVSGRDHAIGSIAYALLTAGNFEEALSLVCQIDRAEMRANAIGEVFYAQKQQGDGSNAERTAAKIDNEEVKKQAFRIIENINRGTYQPAYGLKFYGTAYLGETFSSMYLAD